MTDNFDKPAHTTRWISVKHLSVIWVSAQRPFDPKHSTQIAKDFDPDMFGVLSVSLANPDGVHHVIDGQHRKNAIQSMFGDDEKVPCNIFDAEDPARAAEIFDRINTNRKSPHPIDRFLIRVTAKSPDELAVNQIVEALGFRVAKGGGRGTIRSVDALVSTYRNHGNGFLAKTLQIIRDTWGDDPHATDGTIIRGYASFLAEYHSQIREDRLILQVKKVYTPGQILSHGKAAAEFNRTTKVIGVKHVLVKAYGERD